MGDNPLVNITSNGEILNIFHLDCEQGKNIFFYHFYFQHYNRSISQ